jgi:hypothetical protein
VVIATPPYLHHTVAIAALESGKRSRSPRHGQPRSQRRGGDGRQP